jgi:hypothetical protein
MSVHLTLWGIHTIVDDSAQTSVTEKTKRHRKRQSVTEELPKEESMGQMGARNEAHAQLVFFRKGSLFHAVHTADESENICKESAAAVRGCKWVH